MKMLLSRITSQWLTLDRWPFVFNKLSLAWNKATNVLHQAGIELSYTVFTTLFHNFIFHSNIYYLLFLFSFFFFFLLPIIIGPLLLSMVSARLKIYCLIPLQRDKTLTKEVSWVQHWTTYDCEAPVDRDLRCEKYPFNDITPRSTQSQSGSTC